MNIVEGNLQVDKTARVAIINARFNHFITDRLVEGRKMLISDMVEMRAILI